MHSTHLYVNLPRILEYGKLETAGALKRSLGTARAAKYLHDARRYEQFAVGLDYINCSLSAPNYELLYHRSKSNWSSEWVHLGLDLVLLDRSTTLFCPVSAATERGKYLAGGLAAFQNMFASKVERWDRQDLAKPEPTHPQAELLIADSLDIKSVIEILVPSAAVQTEVVRLLEFYQREMIVTVAPQLFVWPARLAQSTSTK